MEVVSHPEEGTDLYLVEVLSTGNCTHENELHVLSANEGKTFFDPGRNEVDFIL